MHKPHQQNINFVDVGERIRGECMLCIKRCFHHCFATSWLKVLEDCQETFFKKCLDRGLGQRPKRFKAYLALS